MSYAYEFSKRALTRFKQLEPWLAEETLDELEALLTRAPSSGPTTLLGEVHDFVRQRGDQTLYVFLTIKAFPARELLRVTSLGIYVRRG